MNILVTGASGIIGVQLVRQLRELGHTVFALDQFKCAALDDTPFFESTSLNSLFFRDKSLDLVIHLAEDNSITTIAESILVNNNVTLTAQILRLCAQHDVRCLMGSWGIRETFPSMEPHGVLVASLSWREKLIRYFNKGNCIVTEVVIPNILDPMMPESIFGSFAQRAIGAVTYDRSFFILEDEFTRTSHPIGFLPDTIETFINLLDRRTRQVQYAPSFIVPPFQLIGHVLHLTNSPGVIITSSFSDEMLIVAEQINVDPQIIDRYRTTLKEMIENV